MTLKIKIKRIPNAQGKMPDLPKVIGKGDWIDLQACKASEDFMTTRPMIPLGIAVRLPKGCEAIVAPRSSSFKQFGIIAQNSIGVIDNSYCGDGDQWHFPAIRLNTKRMWKVGDRVCQFRVQLSQKATVWQKLRWLLSNGVEIIEVDSLGGDDRGGFGSTGK